MPTGSPRRALLGRRRESEALEGLLDVVRGGESRALVVRGEAGIGKTALLDHAIERATGFRVARAAGVQSEMELPFAGVHQLCASMLDRLACLPDPQRDALGTAFGLGGSSASTGPQITPQLEVFDMQHAITSGDVPFDDPADVSARVPVVAATP